jgi:hypothetical protein
MTRAFDELDVWFARHQEDLQQRGFLVEYERDAESKRLRIESELYLFQALIWKDETYDFDVFRTTGQHTEHLISDESRDFFESLNFWTGVITSQDKRSD